MWVSTAVCHLTVFLPHWDVCVLCLSSVHSQRPLLTVSFTSGDINLMNNLRWPLSHPHPHKSKRSVGLYSVVAAIFCSSHRKSPEECWAFFLSFKLPAYVGVNKAVSTFLSCAVDVVVQWCSQGDLLAVAGMERTVLSPDPSCPPPTRNAIVKFYNVQGEHIYTLDTPAQVIIFSILWVLIK